ncbi:hypothetical protein AB7M22_003197 [Pseudomonas sp. ADAK2 TE3594]
MSERSITQFFSALGAPLCMLRQSWGSASRWQNLRFLRPPLQVRCRLDGILLPKQQKTVTVHELAIY